MEGNEVEVGGGWKGDIKGSLAMSQWSRAETRPPARPTTDDLDEWYLPLQKHPLEAGLTRKPLL